MKSTRWCEGNIHREEYGQERKPITGWKQWWSCNEKSAVQMNTNTKATITNLLSYSGFVLLINCVTFPTADVCTRAYLAPEHEREGPVAADDLTLAHDRRETLKIPDRQRHQSKASHQTHSTDQSRLVRRHGTITGDAECGGSDDGAG